ncbi:MAG: sugar-binding transcriptional regulator [Hyphomicrobiales bacterium]
MEKKQSSRRKSFDSSDALRLRATWMYYSHGRTQREIAEKLGVSRTTVIRLLEDARQRREVRFWIEEAEERCVQLGIRLEKHLGLNEAIVIPSGDNHDETSDAVGLALGKYLSNAISDNMTIGVGWGRTLTASLVSFRPSVRQGVKVLPLLGGAVEPLPPNPVEYCWRLGNAIGADCYLFPSPLIVDSAQTKQSLIERCGLETIFRMSKNLDIAVISVGDIGPNCTSSARPLISEEDLQALIDAGCVADVLCNFIGRDGKDIVHPIRDRVMSVGLQDIETSKLKILASGGVHRSEAIVAAIKRIGFDVLVTDEGAAAAILEHEEGQ